MKDICREIKQKRFNLFEVTIHLKSEYFHRRGGECMGWSGWGGVVVLLVVGNKKIKKGKVEIELYRKSHTDFEQ